MATMQFTDADRDEQGRIRLTPPPPLPETAQAAPSPRPRGGTVAPGDRRPLSDMLGARAAPAEPKADTPPQVSRDVLLLVVGLAVAAILIAGINVIAPPADDRNAGTLAGGSAATAAPLPTEAPADPVVARNYFAPGGDEAGALRRSTVAAGFAVLGRCSTAPGWLRVSPRAPGESWEAWVEASAVGLDPASDAPDLCRQPAPAPVYQPPAAPAYQPAPVAQEAPPPTPAPPAPTVCAQNAAGLVCRADGDLAAAQAEAAALEPTMQAQQRAAARQLNSEPDGSR